MKLLNEIKRSISQGGYAKYAHTLAHAAASACNSNFGVSLLRIDVGLDYQNKQLVLRLLNITSESDFSNAAQDEMLVWLEENGWLEKTPTVMN